MIFVEGFGGMSGLKIDQIPIKNQLKRWSFTQYMLVKTFNKDNKSTLNVGNQEKISYEEDHYQQIIWKVYIGKFNRFLCLVNEDIR